KSITTPPLGTLTNVGSLPMNLILSPGGKFAVSTGMGLRQSLVSIRTSDGTAASHFDFPNNPGPAATSNVLYYGLAFKPNGTLYAARGSKDTIAVFSFAMSMVHLRRLEPLRPKPATTHPDWPSTLAESFMSLITIPLHLTSPRASLCMIPERWPRSAASLLRPASVGHRISRSQSPR